MPSLDLARAAARAGIPFILSATSLTKMEKVIDAAPGRWFQAYLPGAAGVLHGIDLLRGVIDRNLAMLGIDRVSEIDRSILEHAAAASAV